MITNRLSPTARAERTGAGGDVVILLSVDPASHGCGCALWHDGKLVAAGYVPGFVIGSGPRECASSAMAAYEWTCAVVCRLLSVEAAKEATMITHLAFEYPQVYSRGAGKTKGDPNKCVLPLVAVDAALCALFPNANVSAYQPHEWKHGTSKPEQKDIGKIEYVITTRVKERLTPEELAAIRWPNLVSNATKEDHKRSFDIADAVGVGLYHLGRFERKRVYSRE